MLKGRPFSPIGAAAIPEGRERALANRLVTVSLRRHGQISFILSSVLEKGLPARSGGLEAILRIGIAQLLYIEDIPAHSAIHLAVEAARADRRAQRLAKLVNAVLRSVQRRASEFAALPASLLFPDWLAQRWARVYGSDVLTGFAEPLLAGAPLDLTFKRDDPALAAALNAVRLGGSTFRLATRDAPVPDLAGFAQGAWWVQDFAASLAARVTGVRPGDAVLDMCAAPGGKTAQLAAMGARVTALDRDPDRMARLEANLARLGLKAESVVGDALEHRSDTGYDAVLLDAPCSATGTFRRHPDVLVNRTAQGIAERVEIQRALFERAVSLLKPGGTLVYCVCSLETEEGENQLDWALGTFDELAISPIGPEALEGWSVPLTESGAIRTHPGMAVPGPAAGTLDGFFIARFTRR